MRQDDGAAGPDGAAPSDRGGGRARRDRRGRDPPRRRGLDAAEPVDRHRDDLPGRDERVQPGEDGRLPDRRADGVPRDRDRLGREGPGRRTAPAGGDPALGRGPLSARVLRRDAAAGGDRDGPRVQPEGAPSRRADDRARRDGPGADPAAPGVLDEGARPGRDPRDARPAARHAGLRTGRRDVRRAHRGVRAGRHALPRSAPSVHAAAVRGDAGPQRRRGRRVDPGSAAPARSRAHRVPLRTPMRPDVRSVQGPDARAGHGRGWRTKRPVI